MRKNTPLATLLSALVMSAGACGLDPPQVLVGCRSNDECGRDEECLLGACTATDVDPNQQGEGEGEGDVLQLPVGCQELSVAGQGSYALCAPSSFVAAVAVCESAGGKLARFDDGVDAAAGRTEDLAILSALQSRSLITYWVALTDRALEGTFRWEGGRLLDVSPASGEARFATGEPNDRFAEDCVEVGPGNIWNDAECERVLDQVVCESSTAFNAPPTDCTTATVNGRSYLFCTGFRAGIATARTLCSAAGGSVLQLADNGSAAANEKERVDVDAAARVAGLTFYWLDLTDAAREGTFVWSNGVTLDRSPTSTEAHFAAGEPNDALGEDCVRSTSQGWFDADCAAVFPAVCEL